MLSSILLQAIMVLLSFYFLFYFILQKVGSMQRKITKIFRIFDKVDDTKG